MTERIALLGLAVLLIGGLPARAPAQEHVLKDGEWVEAVAADPNTPEGRLAALRRLVDQGEGREAVDEAEDFIEEYPKHPGRQEAMVLLGQAWMLRGRYFDAYEAFETYLTMYPGGRFVERAMQREFEIADAFLRGRKRLLMGFLPITAREDGLEILVRLAEHAPKTKMAEKALMRIGEYHYDRGEYLESLAAFDRYLDAFGESDRAGEAMLKAALSAYRSFRGPEHDETPLVEAEQRFRLLMERYPERARRAGAADILRDIAHRRAEKRFHTAEFYERVNRPRSAARYYAKVVREFPATAWADQARSALNRIEPAKPVPDGKSTNGEDSR